MMHGIGKRVLVMAVLLSLAAGMAWAQGNPSMLVFPGSGYSPLAKLDFVWMNELHAHGLDLATVYSDKLPPAETLNKYNVLVIIGLPLYEPATVQALDAYLASGGGLFLLPDLQGYAGSLATLKSWNQYLAKWGAKIPLEHVYDTTTRAMHPRSTRYFVYTDKIQPSPVSEGVKALWFPGGEEQNWAFHAWGHAMDVSGEWTVVAKGGDASYTVPMVEVGSSAEHDLLKDMYFRPDPKAPPVLFAVRPAGPGRIALGVINPIMTLYGGKSWIHEGVLIDKGLQGRPSYFGKLFENTVKWLAEPAQKAGAPGGYAQDPVELKHPNMRRTPTEYFSEFDSYQNPTPPAGVFRGLIGARTAYSSGKGTVAEWAAAARAAKLDFVVFTEDLAALTEAKYRKLEEECKTLSGEDLTLIPGLAMKNNLGNYMWGHGFGITWFKPSQLTGPQQDQLRLQCMDEKGELYYSDEDAKNWLWTAHGVTGRNVGYYDFTKNPGVPVRNLRLFGILAVVTYRGGKQIEDLTQEYLDYVTDGCPPLAGAMDVIFSPQELRQAVAAGHYLTHVGTSSRKEIPAALQYGHQYGRPNVYVSSGPQIRSWGGTQRFSTYAGESFVTARRVAKPELWVTSEVGLKEIVIYTEQKPYRRFLCNGAKEFHQVFTWAFDRHREMVAIITDVNGGRAVSVSRSQWSDTNYNGWCNDRQNGELWHGPMTFPGPRRPAFSVGPTWDGGPPPQPFGPVDPHPGVYTADKGGEGCYRLYTYRWMEGNQYPTCYDDVCANAAAESENVYAPGVVANAYNTLGPCEPSKLFKFTLRRTQFLQRPAGVNLDWHSMYPERADGACALFEGTATLRQDMDLRGFEFTSITPHSYPKDESSLPLMALNTGDGLTGLGRVESYDTPDGGKGLGPQGGTQFPLLPGGYVGMIPSGLGNGTVVFNADTQPMVARVTRPFGGWWVLSPTTGPVKAGQQFTWRYFAVGDALDMPNQNQMRLEALRKYYFGGAEGCGLKLARGKLLSVAGIVEAEPQGGVVEFEVANPGWKLRLPLGFRFRGFNPNWTVGELQVEGYTQGFYTNGKNVWRQLGPDDRDLVHLCIYPDYAKVSHSRVGHPVQCDKPQLIIEVTQVSAKPAEWHVAVNNPTDAPIVTTLKKAMELPGFELADTPVTVPAGGYLVVKEK